MQKKSLIYSTFILTLASVISRLSGFVYRIYMSNEIGAYGMGQYQLIMPVYMLCWSLICSGFTIAISKLTSQELAKNQIGNAYKILISSTVISFTLSIFISLILYNFSSFIALRFFNTGEISTSLKILSISLPFMSIGSCFRGYFLGLQQPTYPSIAQVLEQFTRIGCIFFFIGVFGNLTVEIAILGIVFAEATATIFILATYIIFKNKHKLKSKKANITYINATNLVLVIAIPITANKVLGSFLTTYENILITEKLVEFGLSKESALTTLGSTTGMAMPLIFFPTAIITSIAVSLMPAISSSVATKNFKKVNSLINNTLLFTSVVGFGVAMLFIVFGYEISILIYNHNLGFELFALSLSAPLMYIQIILSSSLNGLGLQMYTFINNLSSSIIALLTIYFFMPVYGMYAFYIAIFLSCTFTVISNANKIVAKTGIKLDLTNILIKPLLVSLSTGLFTNYIYNNFKTTQLNLNLIMFISLMTFVYGLLCIVVDIISIKDLEKIIKYIKPKNIVEKIE